MKAGFWLVVLSLTFVHLAHAQHMIILPNGQPFAVSENGKGKPNGNSEHETFFKDLPVSTDSEYGLTPGKPIPIGGYMKGAGVGSAWSKQYLASILGPEGQKTQFERIGICCPIPLSTSSVPQNGFVDVYKLTYEGSDRVVNVFI